MSSDQIIVHADAPRVRGPDWRGGRLLLAAVLAVCVVLLAFLLFVWTNTGAIERRVFVGGLLLIVLAALVIGLYWLWTRARQAAIVRLPNQHPLTLRQVAQQPYAFAAESLHQHYAVQHAEASRPNPLLTTLHHTQQHTETHAAAPAPALPAPDEAEAQILAIPVDEWLDWIDTVPHVILAAQTGGGKSTTAKAILAPRIARGEAVFVIDPHSSGWFDLPSVGGGLNWLEVRQASEAVACLYLERMQERDEHLRRTGQEPPPDHFPRLTVLLDEANETRRHLDVATGRGATTPWTYFAEVLGSGARKVNISVILLMQSANVEDLGLSGPMRNNFTRIALDWPTIKLLISQEEKDKARRDLLYAALIGRSFPAATVREAQALLLDRTGLDARPKPASAAASIWPGWAAYQLALTSTQPQQLPTPAAVPAAPPTVADRITEYLKRQPHQKLTDIAAALGEDKQVIQNALTPLFDDKTLTRRGKRGQYEYRVA